MSDRPSSAIPYYVRALAMGIPALMLGLQLATWAGFVRMIRDGHADFRTFYTAGYMVRTGHAGELFDYDAVKATQDAVVSPAEISLPYIHPAYEAALFAPLSELNYFNAYFAFLALNLAALVLTVWILWPRLSKLSELGPWTPAGLAICFVPTGVALMQGQDSILLLLVLVGASAELHKRRDFTAGLILGLGAFRFQIVAPIALLFLLWRCWQFVSGFVVSSGALAALSLWMTGIRGARENVQMLLAMSSGVDPLYQRPIGAMPNMRGFLFGVAHSWITSPAIGASSLIASFAVLLIIGYLRPRRWHFRISIVAAALTSYHFLVHDLTILLLPLLVTLNDCLCAEALGDKAKRNCLWSAAAAFASPLLLLFGIDHFYLAALAIGWLLVALICTAPERALLKPMTSVSTT